MHEAEEIIRTAEQKLTEYLTTKNMRRTPERYEILSVVCQLSGIFTIDQLAEGIQQHGKMQISRTTLFNNLETMVEAQLLTKHTLARAAQYELNLDSAPKIYLVCEKCHKVTKADHPELAAQLAVLKSKTFVVQQPILYLHGLCRKCYMEQKRKSNKKQ